MKQLIIIILIIALTTTLFSENKSDYQKQLEEIIIGHQIKVFDSETFDASDPRHYPSTFQYLFLYDGTFYAFDETMRIRLGVWKTYNLEDGLLGIELITYETSTTMNVILGIITNMTNESFVITIKGGLEIEFHRAYYKDDNGLVWMY